MSLPRILITPMVGLISYSYIKTFKDLRKSINLYLLISLLACLSLPFQMIFGEISWFNNSSFRGGLVRYASLFGNLTAFGIAGGLSLILLLYSNFNKTLKITLIIIFIFSLIISLQKTGLVNIFLSIIIYSIISKKLSLLIRYSVFFVFITYLIICISLYFFTDSILVKYIESIFLNTLNVSLVNIDGVAKDSFTISENILDRIIKHPLEVFDEYGYISLFFGMGVLGGGGSLGISGPQAHNSFFDLLFVGGPMNLFFMIGIIISAFYTTIRILKKCFLTNDQRNIINALLSFLILYIINLPFNSGLLFQPNVSVMFWIFVFFLSRIVSQQKIPFRFSH